MADIGKPLEEEHIPEPSRVPVPEPTPVPAGS
jgi:hypothetical protein